MKKLIIILSILSFLNCNYQEEDSPLKIFVDYPGEYYLLVTNEINENHSNSYLTWGQSYSEWDQEYLEIKLKSSLNKLTITAFKILAPDYSDDKGTLILGIKTNKVQIQEVAEHGIYDVFITYQCIH